MTRSEALQGGNARATPESPGGSPESIDVTADHSPLLARPHPSEEGEMNLGATYEVKGVEPGMGFNSFRCTSADTAVVGEVQKTTRKKTSQTVQFDLLKVTNKRELREGMDVSTAASFAGLCGSFSGKAGWASAQTLSRDCMYVLVKVEVENEEKRLTGWQLGERAAKLTENAGWREFYARFGDAFFSSAAEGGQFFALYQYETTKTSSKQEIATQFEAKYGIGSAEANFNAFMEDMKEHGEKTCKIYHCGGSGQLPEMTAKAVIDAARRFPDDVNPDKDGAPCVYRAATQSYDGMFGIAFPESFRRSRRVFETLFELYERLETLGQATGHLMSQVQKDRFRDLNERIKSRGKEVADDPFAQHEVPSHLEEDVEEFGASLAWRKKPGMLKQLSVGSYDHVWGTSNDEKIFQWNRSKDAWEQAPGGLVNVSAARDGTIWGVNRGGWSYRWDGNTWPMMSSPSAVHLIQISTGGRDLVWARSDTGALYQWENNRWHVRQGPGNTRWVSVGQDGAVFVLGSDNKVHCKTNGDFEPLPFPGILKHVSARDEDEAWGIDGKGRVVRWRRGGWDVMPGEGALVQISVGGDGTVWGVDGMGSVFKLEEDAEELAKPLATTGR